MSRNRGGGHFPSYEEICCASVLAASDYLTNVKWMWLKNMTIPNTVNVDITHIARLASIVEEGVHLDNVTGDKTLLLKSICSKELKLSNIKLNMMVMASVTRSCATVTHVTLNLYINSKLGQLM